MMPAPRLLNAQLVGDAVCACSRVKRHGSSELYRDVDSARPTWHIATSIKETTTPSSEAKLNATAAMQEHIAAIPSILHRLEVPSAHAPRKGLMSALDMLAAA